SEFSVTGDGGVALSAWFTMTGCARLDQVAGEPRCTGPAPLTVTFVPLGEGVMTTLWNFPCGDMGICRQLTPTVTWDQPGAYAVMLSVGGANGTTVSTGQIIVTPGSTGAACDEQVDCDLNGGLECVCAGGNCPGALSLGLCTRPCSATTGCAVGEVCAD